MSGPNFEVFSIDLTRLGAVVGSKDRRLLSTMTRDDDPQELRDAMSAIIVGGLRPLRGEPYSLSRVVLRLCHVIGVRVNGNTADVLHQDSLDAAEKIVRAHKLGLGLYTMVAKGVAPIDGLPVSDEMRFSVVDHVVVRRAHAQWTSASPSHPTDDDADSLLAEMADWLEVAAARGESLVSAYWD